MNLTSISRLLIAGALALYMNSCSSHDSAPHNHDHETEHDHGPEHEHNHENEAEHGHSETTSSEEGFSDEIIVKPETAKRFNITTDTVTTGIAEEIVKTTGRFSASPSQSGIVAAPTSGIITLAPGIVVGKQVSKGTLIATIKSSGISGGDQNAAAKAAMDAAKRELDRLKPLYDDGIVSGRDYNAALQAYETAKSLYSSSAASGRAVAPVSGSIIDLMASQGQYVNTGEPIAAVSASTQMTLVADLPEKYYSSLPQVYDAGVATSYESAPFNISELGGKRVTSSTSVASVKPGYIPVVFTFNNDGRVMDGSMAEVYLKFRNPDTSASSSIKIPKSAISEQQGNYFVYVKLDDHGYRKTLVELGGSDGANVVVKSGLNAGDEIVVTGVSIVRMAETSGVAPEGHSHQH